MKRKFLFSVVIFALILSCGALYARDKEAEFVRSEAVRRNIKLITSEEAKEIASKRLGTENVRYKEIDLEEESDDYPNADNFRPIYQIECVSGGQEYDIDIDAVTGEILKFKLDD